MTNPRAMNPTPQNPHSNARRHLQVGEWYILTSEAGIPRRVRLMTVSSCQRYGRVSYSGKEGGRTHPCLTANLKSEKDEPAPEPVTASPPEEPRREFVVADGLPVRVGDVLRHLSDGSTGVVVALPGDDVSLPLPAVANEMVVSTSPGCTRYTTFLDAWVHIPRDQQTYAQRLQSWQVRPYQHDDARGISYIEGLAIDAIMALLPSDPVDWENGPWPDRFDDALQFLVEHLSADVKVLAKTSSTELPSTYTPWTLNFLHQG